MDYICKKINKKDAVVSVPGSKSVTARAMLISAIAEGESALYGVSLCDDCLTFLNCLKTLGIKCELIGDTLKIEGCGGKLNISEAEINVGSAGTAARFLPAFLAFQSGKFTVKCSEQMKKRPVAPLVEALRSLGAKITFLENENCFPLVIEGGISSYETEVDVQKSSQFLSALLISAVCGNKPVRIKMKGAHGMGYVNMTLDMMWSFGVTAKENGNIYEVFGKYSPKKYDIEPDISSACYFYAMNRLLGTDIKVKGIMPHSMQSDGKFIEIIKTFDGGKIDMGSFSDQALTMAACAPFFKSPTEICGVAHIRAQECDRITAICENLKNAGVKCEEREDGVIIYPSEFNPVKINTFGDHRVAMSFAVAGLASEGMVIENAEVCSKTFPNFFEILDNLWKE